MTKAEGGEVQGDFDNGQIGADFFCKIASLIWPRSQLGEKEYDNKCITQFGSISPSLTIV